MAKIFSTIAKTTKTLSERYADSVVNNDFTTFKSLRDTVSGDLVPSRLLITNRPKKVYDDYTDPRSECREIYRLLAKLKEIL